MFLAIREIRRAKARFSLLIAVIALLVLLILFQPSLQGGLVTPFVWAIRNQSAPMLVYIQRRRPTSDPGQRHLPRSEAQIRGIDGVAEAGRFSQGTFSVMADDTIVQASVIGDDVADLSAPTTLTGGRQTNAAGVMPAFLARNLGIRPVSRCSDMRSHCAACRTHRRPGHAYGRRVCTVRQRRVAGAHGARATAMHRRSPRPSTARPAGRPSR